MRFAARHVWVVLVLVAGVCMTGVFAPAAEAATGDTAAVTA